MSAEDPMTAPQGCDEEYEIEITADDDAIEAQPADGPAALPPQAMQAMLAGCGIEATAHRAADFARWCAKHLWQNYSNYIMDKRKVAETEVNSIRINLPNASKGKEYQQRVALPGEDLAYDFEISPIGEAAPGLEVGIDPDSRCIVISGKPQKSGDFEYSLSYCYPGWCEDEAKLQRTFHLVVNPDPRDLWIDMPTPADIEYFKPDTEHQYIRVQAGADGKPCKDITAASRRGRSHALKGLPRDDHFQLWHSADSQWYAIAVADGAGSAEFSRQGSKVACETAIQACAAKLTPEGDAEFESLIRNHAEAFAGDDLEAKKNAKIKMLYYLYDVLGRSAFAAYKAVSELAEADGRDRRKYATTLLLAIAKNFGGKWLIGTFWVGDGAICLYSKAEGKAVLMGTPDGGEYAGQTRFLTMPEVMTNVNEVFSRINFEITDDFTALMLMTDGVSDPLFGADAVLKDTDAWHRFWGALTEGNEGIEAKGVTFEDDIDNSAQLLQWLNFWKAGEHDDRTIAILY